MSLQAEIDSKRAEIKTDAYPMSIGELISLYENGEIEVHPEFQRYFRWSDTQKTRLIESILLGIPIPSIFVAQQPSGVWDVVDGLQRLSTIFQFVGILRDLEGEIIPPLVLESTKHLPSLGGKTWESQNSEDESNSLTQAQRLILKRAKLGISIILYDSDPRSKYELFQRLNSSGSPLTDQELRNSMLTAINEPFYNWIRSLSQDVNFRICVPITERQMQEQYDLELVLRYLVFRTLDKAYLNTTSIGDLSEFLTDRMVVMAQDKTFNYAEEDEAFRRTFDLLARTTADDSFTKYDSDRGKFVGSFLVTPFEVVALGLGYNYQKWSMTNLEEIKSKIISIWGNREIANNSGSGVRANTRISRTIPYGRELFGI